MRTLALALVTLLMAPGFVLAGDVCLQCLKKGALEPFDPGSLSGVTKALEALGAPGEENAKRKLPGLLDLKLVMDSRLSGDAIQVTTINDEILSGANLDRVQDLYFASLGLSKYEISNNFGSFFVYASSFGAIPAAHQVATDFKAASSFSESLTLLRAAAPSLSRNEKLLILSTWGQKLADGYGEPNTSFTSSEELFNNARDGGAAGGTCRDIHAYLSEMAKALGFDSVGMFSGLQAIGNKGGAHQVDYFRDPKTGEYYVQNYGRIINTHQKQLASVIDIGTRAMGPITTASWVQTTGGRTHLYVPKASRWMLQEINSVRDFKDQPLLMARISNRQQSIATQITKKIGDGQLKAFYLHSDFTASDGPYKIDMAGVAGKIEKSRKLMGSVFDEVGALAEGHLGYLKTFNNVYLDGNTTQTRDNIAFGAKLSGYARIDSVTGKLLFRGETLDYSPSKGPQTIINAGGADNELTASLTYQKENAPTIELSRTAFIGPRDMRKVGPAIIPAYDKLNVIVDARTPDRKVYLESDSRIYALDGVDRFSAIGLQQVVKAAIPTRNAGEFVVLLDVSKIIANRRMKDGRADPFYEVPLRTEVKGEWTKKLTRFVNAGADVSYVRGGDPFHLFEAKGTATPDLRTHRKNEVAGNLWLHFKF